MRTNMYVITHKKFEVPQAPFFVPLQVGRALHDDLGYLGDDTGDQISAQNPFFSELTGLYWIWKNVKDVDIVGICHYRRYLVMKLAGQGERLLQKEDAEQILKTYDMITSERLTLASDYYSGFAVDHNLKDLQCCGQVIREKYPAYAAEFEKLIHEKHTYFGNICVAGKAVYDTYCSWLFDILFEVQRRTDMTGYDGYRKRLYGFLSEFLLYVYTRVNHMKIYECRVAIIGEKTETREVKEQLAEFFRKKDFAGAKKCFLRAYQIKPDILMEASDINGELRLCMQIISTCEFEQETGSTVLEKEQEYTRLISAFRLLNAAIEHYRDKEQTEEDRMIVGSATQAAREVAMRVLCSEDEIPTVRDQIAQELSDKKKHSAEPADQERKSDKETT